MGLMDDQVFALVLLFRLLFLVGGSVFLEASGLRGEGVSGR